MRLVTGHCIVSLSGRMTVMSECILVNASYFSNVLFVVPLHYILNVNCHLWEKEGVFILASLRIGRCRLAKFDIVSTRADAQRHEYEHTLTVTSEYNPLD